MFDEKERVPLETEKTFTAGAGMKKPLPLNAKKKKKRKVLLSCLKTWNEATGKGWRGAQAPRQQRIHAKVAEKRVPE